MLHCDFNCARVLSGALLLLSISGDRLLAQSQGPAGGNFQERFLFDQRRDVPGSSPQEKAPPPAPTERKAPSVLEKLIAPPAAAEPAPPPAEAIRPDPAPALKARRARRTELPAKSRSVGRPIGTGRAAWYGHPGRTASGEKYNPDGLTAAHKTLPLGTKLRVINLRNQRAVDVRVNDRAPRKMKFVIDLSRGSARAIGIKDVGPVALYKLN